MTETNLIRYDVARQALQAASTIDDAKQIKDKVEALRAYARQRNDVQMEAWLSELKLRADRRIGEISSKLDKAKANQSSSLIPTSGKKREVLKAAGLSTSAANRAEKIADIPEQEFEDYIKDKVDNKKVIKVTEVITAITKQKKEQKQKEDLTNNPPEIPAGLFHGDFRDMCSSIPDESVELVFTDPPYDRDSIPLFGDAAKEAARILRPGGSMIAYCGQIQLPEVLGLMSEHLRYWWVNACIHSGASNLMNKYGIRCDWKPMVWFVKGTRGDVSNIIHDSVTGDREKDHHEWQQAESEAEYYISHLCSDNGFVVDFFAGGGTTLKVAQNLGRKWIGYEKDLQHIKTITERLSS